LIARAAACRQRIVEAKLSKYNNTVRPPPAWLRDAKTPNHLGGRPDLRRRVGAFGE
jgi:hypothetical protein